MISLKGKVALVTGASYGIGFTIASCYARAGAIVAFNDINEKLVNEAQIEYEKLGLKVKGYVVDVTDELQVEKLVKDIKNEFGSIDILVNNAGIIKRIEMDKMNAKEFRQVIDVDLIGPFIMSKAVIPDMIEKDQEKLLISVQ